MAKQTEVKKKPESESFAVWAERMGQMAVRNLNKNAKASAKEAKSGKSRFGA